MFPCLAQSRRSLSLALLGSSLAVAATSCTPLAVAQTTASTGSVSGSVLDPDQAAIPAPQSP